MMEKLQKTIIGLLVAMLLVLTVVAINTLKEDSVGGVDVGSEYNYTHFTGSGIASTTLLKTGWGSLGSVIITEDQAGAVILYDATSTEAVTDGASALYTKIATFEDAQAEGVYTFDTLFNNGLVISLAGETFAGNWTVTYR